MQGEEAEDFDKIRVIQTMIHHQMQVRAAMKVVTHAFEYRAFIHDESKWRDDEFNGFANINAVARNFKYGTPEYDKSLKGAKGPDGCITKHFARNPHHPEYWARPQESMTFIDIIEMVCDWWSAWNTYEMQRPDGGGNTWEENMSLQYKRFVLDGKCLDDRQWWLVTQVASLLNSYGSVSGNRG